METKISSLGKDSDTRQGAALQSGELYTELTRNSDRNVKQKYSWAIVRTLYICDCFADCANAESLPENADYAVTEDAGHGRAEKRECFLMQGTAWMGGTHEKWPSVQFGALIRSTVSRNGKAPLQGLHYFIGSREAMTAEQCLTQNANIGRLRISCTGSLTFSSEKTAARPVPITRPRISMRCVILLTTRSSRRPVSKAASATNSFAVCWITRCYTT